MKGGGGNEEVGAVGAAADFAAVLAVAERLCGTQVCQIYVVLSSICGLLLRTLKFISPLWVTVHFPHTVRFGLALALPGLVLVQPELTAASFRHDGLDGPILDWKISFDVGLGENLVCV